MWQEGYPVGERKEAIRGAGCVLDVVCMYCLYILYRLYDSRDDDAALKCQICSCEMRYP